MPSSDDPTEAPHLPVRLSSPGEMGRLARHVRKSLGMTQGELAGSSGVGLRFVVDLEKGKPTCEIGKVLHVLKMLGIVVTATPPVL